MICNIHNHDERNGFNRSIAQENERKYEGTNDEDGTGAWTVKHEKDQDKVQAVGQTTEK
jgi:hypothetical protein